jgi:tRNA(Ile)-lysidine synthase
MIDRPTWTDLHAHLHRNLRSRHLLQPDLRLLIAVSGGQDSLCLMKLLLDLQPKWGWQLGIAHCDHRWRPDSAANARYVEQLARTWELPFHLQTADRDLRSEAAARQWRYQALSTIAREGLYDCIVTGHTASDRAETLLYNLIRGTGTDGLQALTWQRRLDSGIMLVRPLLEVTRAETARFCQEQKIVVWEDATNQDLKYARNRIRQELIPYLHGFNPQVEAVLAQTAELLQTEVEYLEAAARQLRQEAMSLPLDGQCSDAGEAPLKLNRRLLQTAPLALQRRVMRQILQQTLNVSAPNFEHIEKLTALITAPNRSRTDPFPGGSIAEVDGDWILMTNR